MFRLWNHFSIVQCQFTYSVLVVWKTLWSVWSVFMDTEDHLKLKEYYRNVRKCGENMLGFCKYQIKYPFRNAY